MVVVAVAVVVTVVVTVLVGGDGGGNGGGSGCGDGDGMVVVMAVSCCYGGGCCCNCWLLLSLPLSAFPPSLHGASIFLYIFLSVCHPSSFPPPLSPLPPVSFPPFLFRLFIHLSDCLPPSFLFLFLSVSAYLSVAHKP